MKSYSKILLDQPWNRIRSLEEAFIIERYIYIYIYKSCTCPNNLDKNSFSLVKNRQFLEAGERGCSILINLYELSLPPTRQRKYSLNKESPLYRHILSRLIYLLRWKASWGGMQVRPPFQGPDTATSTLSVRRLCSTNVTKGGEIVLRPLETDLSHTRWSSSEQVMEDPDRLSRSLSRYGIFLFMVQLKNNIDTFRHGFKYILETINNSMLFLMFWKMKMKHSTFDFSKERV